MNFLAWLPKQGAGATLALEHALTMVVLLMGLLSIRGDKKRFVPWVVLGGAGLSLLTTRHAIEPAWRVISFLVLPPYLWQLSVRLATARPRIEWRNLAAWLLMAMLVGLALNLAGGMPLARGALTGLLAASLVWQVREPGAEDTDLAAFGQLAVALLLAEVDAELFSQQPFYGSLFSGAGLGLLIGYLGLLLGRRIPAGNPRKLYYLGLGYATYLIAVLIGSSGVAMTTVMGITVATYSFSKGLWKTKEAQPAPLNRGLVFFFLAAAWLLLGWQAHVPVTVPGAIGIVAALAAAAVGILLARLIAPVRTTEQISLARAILFKEAKVFLLLTGVLFLWPATGELTLPLLGAALLAALVIILILRVMIRPVFDLAGVKLEWPDQRTRDSMED